MITISFVRHGESTDNLKSIWAGWKDAPLSNHGMNQAKACGAYFAKIPITTIYASPLLRAYTTAQAILADQPEPRPPLVVSSDLREQHFGIAEGEPWVPISPTGVDIRRKIFPTLHGRDEKFPEAESLNDVARRAERASDDIILPWVWDPTKSWGKGEGEVHLVIVSHGLYITELIAALVRKDADGFGRGNEYRGLLNTAWTRVTVAVKGEDTDAAPSVVDKSAPLVVRVIAANQHEHLVAVTRQKGGIGSSAYDPAQKDIREFFGGGAAKTSG